MISYLWKYCPKYIVLSCVSAIVSINEIIFSVLFIRYLINALVNQEAFISIIQTSAIVMGVMVLIIIFNLFFQDYYYPYIMNKVQKQVQGELIQKASKIDLVNYDDPEFYNKYVWLIQDADFRALETFRNVMDFVRNGLSLLFLLVTVIVIDPVMLLFSLIPLIFSMIINTKMGKIRYKLDEEKIPYERKRDYVKRVFYLQQYAKEVRLTNIKQVLMGNFNQNIESIIGIVKKHGVKLALLDILTATIHVVLGTMVSMVYLSLQVYRGVLSLGDFSALLSGSGQINTNIQGLFMSFPRLYQNSLYIKNFRAFMEYEHEHKQTKVVERPAVVKLDITNVITCHNVTFTYPNQAIPTLHAIDINLTKGENIAIVGHNGAGKSTLVKLLLGLYTPQQGNILLYGKDCSNYDKSSYHRYFGSVLQDFQLYALSVAENILMREVRDAKQDEWIVWRALERVGMKDKIKALPNGIYTQCFREFDRDGIEFSGGEKQRIALARIFATPCDIVILDEPSSALDPIAEHEIYLIIMEHCLEKSIIFISHHLSSIKHADRIYLLDKGEVLETGTHEELMQLKGEYQHMFQIQAEKYNHSIDG